MSATGRLRKGRASPVRRTACAARAEGPPRQGGRPMARAPVMGWNEHDRGPQADAEERTRSAHRAIESREKRRRVLLSCLAGIDPAHPARAEPERPAGHSLATRPRTRRTPRYARHSRPAATRTSQVPSEDLFVVKLFRARSRPLLAFVALRGAVGRRLGCGPGVAGPKSRCLGCEPAAWRESRSPVVLPGLQLRRARQCGRRRWPGGRRWRR